MKHADTQTYRSVRRLATHSNYWPPHAQLGDWPTRNAWLLGRPSTWRRRRRRRGRVWAADRTYRRLNGIQDQRSSSSSSATASSDSPPERRTVGLTAMFNGSQRSYWREWPVFFLTEFRIFLKNSECHQVPDADWVSRPRYSPHTAQTNETDYILK